MTTDNGVQTLVNEVIRRMNNREDFMIKTKISPSVDFEKPGPSSSYQENLRNEMQLGVIDIRDNPEASYFAKIYTEAQRDKGNG